jgi:hypothetical protein
MAALRTLAPDILDLLTRKLYGGAVLRLWCTGDLSLQTALQNGGVTRLMLVDRARFTTTRYPKLLPCLHQLRRLKLIYSSERLGDPYDIGRELQRLSPRLEKLELTFDGAEECLMVHPLEGGILNRIFDEEGSDFASGTDAESPLLWDLAKFLPALRSLKLEDMKAHFTNEHIKFLPRGLQKLWFSISTNLTTAMIPDLPPALTDLYLPSSLRLELEDIKRLPQGLLELAPTLENIDLPKVQALPRSMTNMMISVDSPVSPIIEALPPALTELHLHIFEAFDAAAFKALPETLTKFSMTTLTEHELINVCILIQSLPRSLTHLHMYGVTESDASDLRATDWPPNLTYFSKSQCNWKITPSFFSTFPSSLTELTLAENQYHDDRCTDDPDRACHFATHSLRVLCEANLSNLRTLDISFSNHTFIEVDAPFALPKHLENLFMWGTFELNESVWLSLPHSLATFCYCASEIYSIKLSGLQHIPKSLTVLDLSRYDGNIQEEDFQHFPRLLTSLEIPHWTGELTTKATKALSRELKILDFSEASVTDPEVFKNLPETLEIWRLKLISNCPGDSLGLLPRSLKTLSIQTFEDLQNKDLAALPAGLASLSIHTSGDITYQAAQYLPPDLQFIAWDDVSNEYFRCRKQTRSFPVISPDPRVTARFRKN